VQDGARMKELALRPGRKWVIVERARYGALRQAIGEKVTLRIADRSTNKFYLVELDPAGQGPQGQETPDGQSAPPPPEQASPR